jgi:UDP-N-acetylmuramoyl-L-alanyl-D-glutamate--2,6-diaminopimelate ligase
LERIDNDRGLGIFVDYAHTEDALKNVLSSLKGVQAGKMIIVFGCGGDRDKTKRPKMGRVASQLADHVIITTDNSRSEDPDAIIQDIILGLDQENYSVIPDRVEAIHYALKIAEPNDIVLIAGKGHETYQIFKQQTIPFDDRQVVRDMLSRKQIKV